MLTGSQKISLNQSMVCSPQEKLETETAQQKYQQEMQRMLQRQKTPLITSEYIVTRIKGGTKARRTEILKSILQAKQIHSDIALYVDLAFTHLPDFQIYIYTQEQLKELGFEAVYFPALQILILPETNSDSQDNLELLKRIRHEFRHAAMNAMQRALWNPNPLSAKNYFPLSDESELRKMIKKGDDKVKAFAEGKLSKAEKMRFLKLSEKIRIEYKESYQVIMDILLPQEIVKKIKKDLGKALNPGSIINLDKYTGQSLGDVRIEKVSLQNDGSQVISFTCLGPLQASLYKLLQFPTFVEKNYRKNTQMEERDAYLFEAIPVSVIEFFYPEFYRYTHDLIYKAMGIPVIQNIPSAEFLSPNQLYLELIIQGMRWVHVEANSENAKKYLLYADALHAHGYTELAKQGLQKLINHELMVSEAKAILNRLNKGNLLNTAKKPVTTQKIFNYQGFAKAILSSPKLNLDSDLENYFALLLADKLEKFLNIYKLDPTVFPDNVTQGLFNKIQKQLIDNKTALLTKPILVVNQILASCKPRMGEKHLNLLTDKANVFDFNNLQTSTGYRVQPYGFITSLLNSISPTFRSSPAVPQLLHDIPTQLTSTTTEFTHPKFDCDTIIWTMRPDPLTGETLHKMECRLNGEAQAGFITYDQLNPCSSNDGLQTNVLETSGALVSYNKTSFEHCRGVLPLSEMEIAFDGAKNGAIIGVFKGCTYGVMGQSFKSEALFYGFYFTWRLNDIYQTYPHQGLLDTFTQASTEIATHITSKFLQWGGKTCYTHGHKLWGNIIYTVGNFLEGSIYATQGINIVTSLTPLRTAKQFIIKTATGLAASCSLEHITEVCVGKIFRFFKSEKIPKNCSTKVEPGSPVPIQGYDAQRQYLAMKS